MYNIEANMNMMSVLFAMDIEKGKVILEVF